MIYTCNILLLTLHCITFELLVVRLVIVVIFELGKHSL